jgi:hypothetical protein
MEKELVSGLHALQQFFKRRQYVGARGFARCHIAQHDERPGWVASRTLQIRSHVVNVVDAPVQLVLGSIVVYADHQCALHDILIN